MTVSQDWQNLKSFLRKTYNREVNEYFRDEPDDDPDNSTPRRQVKRSCLILPDDGQNKTLIKMLAFRFTVQQVHLRPNVYGIPVDQYQEDVTFRPQVTLFFKQDAEAVPEDFSPIEGEISFRLMDETSQSMTKAKANTLANKIKNKFALANGYFWKKGKIKLVYKDASNGLNLSILCLTEAEGIDLIKDVCSVAGATYDDDILRNVTPKKNSVNTPGSHLIMGESVKKRRWRPTGNVRFRYAELSIHGLNKTIALNVRLDALNKNFEAQQRTSDALEARVRTLEIKRH